MRGPVNLRELKLRESDWIPLWHAVGGLSAEGIKLSPELCARLLEWEEAIWAAPVDEKTMDSEGYGVLTNGLRREGGSIAQLIAVEMGEGVTVEFETVVYSSAAPPTNPAARAELDEIAEKHERALLRSQNSRRSKRVR